MVFECKFGCGITLYKGDDARYYEESTDERHVCPNLQSSIPNRDPANHSPSKYITEKETRDVNIENTLHNIEARLANLEEQLTILTGRLIG
jgi:hypothetical protein